MMNLTIKNFKCFYELEVPINDLTVFAGGNGNGKSTVIQSLLLLRRTVEHCSEWKSDHFQYDAPNNLNVELNGTYCLGLGNSLSVLPIEFDDTEIEFGINNEERRFTVLYDTNKGDELWITPKKVENDYQFPINPLFFQQFYNQY